MSTSEKICIVIPNYFNDDDTIEYIRRELMPIDADLLFTIVNNGSHYPKDIEDFCKRFPGIDLINDRKNYGYLPSLLRAYGEHKRIEACADWYVLSNSDLKIITKDFFTCFRQMALERSVAAAGPAIISTKTKHDQNPFSRKVIQTGKLKWLISVFRYYSFFVLYQAMSLTLRKILPYKGVSSEREEVYAVHGAFVLMRADFVEKLSGMADCIPFLFGEEIIIADTARASGLKILYLPELRIIHSEHETTGLFKSPLMIRYHREALKMCIRLREKFNLN